MTDKPSPQTDEEAFEQWDESNPCFTRDELETIRVKGTTKGQRAVGFFAALRLERERTSAICDKIEALEAECRDGNLDRDDVLALVKEIRR